MTIKLFGFNFIEIFRDEKPEKQADIVYNNCVFEAEEATTKPQQPEATIKKVNIKEVINYTAQRTGLNVELCERVIDVANNFVLYGEQKDDGII